MSEILKLQYYLLLTSVTILFCLSFLFLVIFNNYLAIPAVKEKATLKLALVIPTGKPITVAKEIINIPLLVTDKTIADNQKQQCI